MVMVAPPVVVVVMVVMPMVMTSAVVSPMAMMAAHRLCAAGWIGDGLHGHLGDRRAPHERSDGERRDGNAWKLHVFSL
jgi:hypothetical protein